LTAFPLQPGAQALLVVDMQNDFLRVGAPQEVPRGRDVISVVVHLVNAFRAAGRPVIYTRFLAGPGRTLMMTWSPECGPEMRSCWLGHQREYADCVGPREGAAVVDELASRPDELVVDKYGYGAFHNTLLEDALLARGVTQVVVTGVVTQICVEDTVRQGMQRGFEMVVVRDGVASFDEELHRCSLRNLEMKFAIVVDSNALGPIVGRDCKNNTGVTPDQGDAPDDSGRVVVEAPTG
jgi:nicotinamidase-related amidase